MYSRNLAFLSFNLFLYCKERTTDQPGLSPGKVSKICLKIEKLRCLRHRTLYKQSCQNTQTFQDNWLLELTATSVHHLFSWNQLLLPVKTVLYSSDIYTWLPCSHIFGKLFVLHWKLTIIQNLQNYKALNSTSTNKFTGNLPINLYQLFGRRLMI